MPDVSLDASLQSFFGVSAEFTGFYYFLKLPEFLTLFQCCSVFTFIYFCKFRFINLDSMNSVNQVGPSCVESACSSCLCVFLYKHIFLTVIEFEGS